MAELCACAAEEVRIRQHTSRVAGGQLGIYGFQVEEFIVGRFGKFESVLRLWAHEPKAASTCSVFVASKHGTQVLPSEGSASNKRNQQHQPVGISFAARAA